MPTPAYHQSIITELLYQIITYLEKTREPYKVITSPFSLNIHGHSPLLYPDIAIIKWPGEITSLQLNSVPLFVAEINAINTQSDDFAAKLKLYKKMGIKEYWIIDWTNRLLYIYLFCDKRSVSMKPYKLPCKMPVSILPGLELCLDFDT